MLTAIDLFCGAGGTTLGLVNAGFEILGAFDSWQPAAESYHSNFPFPLMLSDPDHISEQEICNFIGSTSVDLLAGCPPCHGFSVKGNDVVKGRTPHSLLHFVRMIEALTPQMFLIEDVPVFIGRRDRDFTEEFVRSLMALGYTVEWRKINAADYGVPQIRKRLYYYGWRNNGFPAFKFPEPDHSPETAPTVADVILDLPSPHAESSKHQGDPLHRLINTSELNLKRLSYVRPGKGYQDIPEELWPSHRQYGGYRLGHNDIYGRLHPEKPAGAITTGFDSFTRGKFGHPFKNRNITLREGARLQTFPDSFIFKGNQRDITRLIGNAAPPLIIEKIAVAIAKHFFMVAGSSALSGRHITRTKLRANSPSATLNISPSELHQNNGVSTTAIPPKRPKAPRKYSEVKPATAPRKRSNQDKRKQRELPLLEAVSISPTVDSVKGGDLLSPKRLEQEEAYNLPGAATSLLPDEVGEHATSESQASPLLRVFLCHSSNDKPVVRDLYRRLREDGVSPWLDEEDLLPGQKWEVEIPKAVRSSDAVIVCLSRISTTKKGYVNKELQYALDIANEYPEDTIFLIPLRLEECDVPQSLADRHWVNFYEERGYELLMRALRRRAGTL